MLTTLVFSTTYRCIIECKLCGLSCNPRRKEQLSLEFMKSIMDEYLSFDAGAHVTFTGGEPFLLQNDLLEAIRYAKGHGFTTRVVTNGFWGSTFQKSYDMLKQYQDAGLTEINVSVDDFHQEFIPIQNVKNIHDACIDLDMQIILAHKALKNSRVTIPYLEKVFEHELYDLDDERRKISELEEESKAKAEIPKAYVYGSSGCIPVGPGSSELSDDDLLYRYNPSRFKYRCSSALRDIVITPNEELNVCCGVVTTEIPELSFSSLRKNGLAATLRRANEDLYINWLVLEGPYGMMKYVKSKNPNVKFRDMYVGPCHLCHDVFTIPESREVLRQVDEEKIEEIHYRRLIYDLKRENQTLYNRMFNKPVE